MKAFAISTLLLATSIVGAQAQQMLILGGDPFGQPARIPYVWAVPAPAAQAKTFALPLPSPQAATVQVFATDPSNEGIARRRR